MILVAVNHDAGLEGLALASRLAQTLGDEVHLVRE